MPTAARLASADPYTVLGLRADADAAAVRRRYRELARLLHPDRVPAAAAAAAGDAFIQLQRAYDALASAAAF